MKKVTLYKNHEKLLAEVRVCSLWHKTVGYMFMAKPRYAGLIFTGEKAVHMFWVRFPLLIIVLDREQRVLAWKILKPGQIGFWRQAQTLIETPDLTLAARLTPGDILEIR